MANSFTRVWILDTEGMITAKPVWIHKIVLFPNAADDLATLTYWDTNGSPRTTMEAKTVTVTNTYDILSTGNFEAAEVVVNDIMEIYVSDTGNNIGNWQVDTRTDDNNIVVDIGLAAQGQAGGAMDNEASKVYNWKMWPPIEIATLSCFDANEPYTLDFVTGYSNRGKFFPNLALHTLDASAVVYIYYS